MKLPYAVLLLAFALSGCGDSGSGTSYDPTKIESANRILAASGLPTIPDNTNAKAYSWSLMAAGVIARFDYSADFMGKIEDDLVAFSETEPLPKEIGRLGITDTPWFTPTTIQNGNYLIKDLSDDGGTPKELVVVVDADRTTIYLAYSWN